METNLLLEILREMDPQQLGQLIAQANEVENSLGGNYFENQNPYLRGQVKEQYGIGRPNATV